MYSFSHLEPVCCYFYILQFSRSVVFDSLRPHELQLARPPCPSPPPGVHSDSRPSSPWCHPAISSSVAPFSCPKSLPASESFPMSQLFTWAGQSIGVSALASFLPKLCPILCDPMDCSTPVFSVHVILQARILEWAAMPPSLLISPHSKRLQKDKF